MAKIAIYPGSFDPVTNGHLDILHRALRIFDKIVIAVTEVESKKTLFTIEERVRMLKKATARWSNVTAESFSGLLVRYAKRKGASAILRGLRAVSDFEYEFQMALMNRSLSKGYEIPQGYVIPKNSVQGLETLFLMPDEKYTYLSSTVVKEVARLGGNIKSFVPAFVEKELKRKFSQQEK